ncbi:MAG: hypothetical protein U0527_08595 [Candidatus Eisenbacteria bacterium]
MLNKAGQFFDLLDNEAMLLKHLHSKITPAMLEYRPSGAALDVDLPALPLHDRARRHALLPRGELGLLRPRSSPGWNR